MRILIADDEYLMRASLISMLGEVNLPIDLIEEATTGEEMVEMIRQGLYLGICYNPIQRDWAWSLLEVFGMPPEVFPKIIPPGTVLGCMLPRLSEELQLGSVPIVAPACHDTASAVAAVPAQNDHFAWIGSGTWSIMGIESPKPVIDEKTLKYNFTIVVATSVAENG